MKFSTPIAFLIFNRPQLTEKVFNRIAQIKPQKLLVVADGPRFPEEVKKCEKTRSIIDKVDWDCEILTNFSHENLGCRKRISSGISWVFSQVEEAIILEDDCLPDLSFFSFCQTLLEKYRDDERIMHISGNNFQLGQSRTPYSYYYSIYNHNWGWASWRRAWQHYDVDMKTWPEYQYSQAIRSIFEHPEQQKYWCDRFEETFKGNVDTWDYQWTYACWSQQGIAILPDVNLVSNIGFGVDATHTTSDSFLANLPTGEMKTIKHPPFVATNREADTFTFWRIFLDKEAKSINQVLQELEEQVNQDQAEITAKEELINQQIDSINHLEQKLSTAQEFLVAMESSKFWKLRNKWLKLKAKLNLPTDPNIGSFSEKLESGNYLLETQEISYKQFAKQSLKKIINQVKIKEEFWETQKSVRQQFKADAKLQKNTIKTEARSPLTGSDDITLLEVMSAQKLIDDWQLHTQIDITEEFNNCSEIYLYRCNQTKLKFFYPFETVGSDKLYEQLDRFDWYYTDEKWEYALALRDLEYCETVLEIGSGFGFFVEKAQREDINITGIELNEHAVTIAQRKQLPVKKIDLQIVAENSPNAYDAVCSFQVLEHVVNPKDFIRWAVEALKPGGKLILGVPNAKSFLKHQYCLLDMPPHHMSQWSASTFKALEKLFPLQLTKVEYEPLADYHVTGYLTSYRDYICSVSPFGKYLFNEAAMEYYEQVLNQGLRKWFPGQTLYVEFEKLD
ncbi:MAG: methyltransferase domain-containing protein [Crocosphaera sp.]